ncbi:MAG: hypothetical protein ACM3Q4_05320 [Acidobacteriota bacterium]
MLRIILFIIAIYIIAKIVGAALHIVRFMSGAAEPKRTPKPEGPRPGSKIPYSNVEDVDFEDLPDKK